MIRIAEARGVIACEDCLGDGGSESRPYGYDPRDGTPLTRWVTCALCQGEREAEVRLEPPDVDDDLAEREEELAPA